MSKQTLYDRDPELYAFLWTAFWVVMIALLITSRFWWPIVSEWPGQLVDFILDAELAKRTPVVWK